jgi:hypothetical protein
MLPEENTSHPSHWLPNILVGIAFVLLGGAPYLFSKDFHALLDIPLIPLLTLVSAFIGVYLIHTGVSRKQSVKTTYQTSRKIRLPYGWHHETNLNINESKKLSLLLTNRNGDSFAVDIKSSLGVMIKRGSPGRPEEIRYKDGRCFSQDPVAEVLEIAEICKARPVLWYASAKRDRPIRMQCGVIVVQGDDRDLVRALKKYSGRSG